VSLQLLSEHVLFLALTMLFGLTKYPVPAVLKLSVDLLENGYFEPRKLPSERVTVVIDH